LPSPDRAGRGTDTPLTARWPTSARLSAANAASSVTEASRARSSRLGIERTRAETARGCLKKGSIPRTSPLSSPTRSHEMRAIVPKPRLRLGHPLKSAHGAQPVRGRCDAPLPKAPSELLQPPRNSALAQAPKAPLRPAMDRPEPAQPPGCPRAARVVTAGQARAAQAQRLLTMYQPIPLTPGQPRDPHSAGQRSYRLRCNLHRHCCRRLRRRASRSAADWSRRASCRPVSVRHRTRP
jgi:hypothetical protein